MLYLIGGAPRCGKTTFSKMLARSKNIPWISTDLIAGVVKEYSARPLTHGNSCVDSPESLLQGELENAAVLWPGVRHFILSLLKWRHDYVVEGVHLLPEYVHELEQVPEWALVRDRVRIVYLVKTDEQKIVDGLRQGDKSSDWLLQCIGSEDDLRNAAKMIVEKARYIERGARAHGYRVVMTDDRFRETLEALAGEY
jgi:2-phosphoglycerate kinase